MNHIFVLTGTAALLFAEQNGHYTPLIPQQPDSEDETAEAPTLTQLSEQYGEQFNGNISIIPADQATFDSLEWQWDTLAQICRTARTLRLIAPERLPQPAPTAEQWADAGWLAAHYLPKLARQPENAPQPERQPEARSEAHADSNSDTAALQQRIDELAAENTQLRRAAEQAQHFSDGLNSPPDTAELRRQIALLQAQTTAPETVFAFLPVVYRSFWTHIKPSDIALIAGSLNVPAVPNPFPEPDAHTIAAKKKQLLANPQQQAALKAVCAQLPGRLEARAEFRFLFED